MWGTDIPMTLFDNENYAEQFSKFYKYTDLVALTNDISFRFTLPPTSNAIVADHESLIERLVNTNPANFMFAG